MDISLYDKNGRPIAHIEDFTDIYLYDGRPVAYIDQDAVYAFSGKHLGWFIDDWILDKNGDAVFFSEFAVGGPAKPARGASVRKGARRPRPAKRAKEARPTRPAKSGSWSGYSSEKCFWQ